MAPVPGSSRVLDRTTGHLVPCTPQLCPYATFTAANAKMAVTPESNGANASDILYATSRANDIVNETDSKSAVLVNRVLPLSSISFAINAFAPLPRQAAAFALLHTFTSKQEHLEMLLSPTSGEGEDEIGICGQASCHARQRKTTDMGDSELRYGVHCH